MASAPEGSLVTFEYYDDNLATPSLLFRTYCDSGEFSSSIVMNEQIVPTPSRQGYKFIKWHLIVINGEILSDNEVFFKAGDTFPLLMIQKINATGSDVIISIPVWEKIAQGMYWVLNCGEIDQILEEADFPNNAKYIAELGVVKAGQCVLGKEL